MGDYVRGDEPVTIPPEPPSADPPPHLPLSGGALAAVVGLVLLDAPLVLFAGALTFSMFGSAGGFPEALYALAMLAAALAPLVVLLATRGRKPGLAWGVFLMAFVVAFGACVMVFREIL